VEKVVKGFSEKLREDSALVNLIKEESIKKYGNDS
jgi:hypothetical protein